MTRYCATGSTDSPVHGRGQRTAKKNGRYIESDEEWKETEELVAQEKVSIFFAGGIIIYIVIGKLVNSTQGNLKFKVNFQKLVYKLKNI